MAGLLGNIALATGNNMAQYAHTKQRQDFQGEQLKSQQEHMTKLEEWRMERKEKMALRSREWAVEDRDAGLQGLLVREQIKAEQASQQAEQGQFQQQVEYARADLGQINDDVSKLSAAIRGYDPMTDTDGKGMARLQEDLSRLESRRSMVMEAIPDGVLEAAGPLANATHRELVELAEKLRRDEAHSAQGQDNAADPLNPAPTGLLNDSRLNIPGSGDRPTIPELWKKFRQNGMPQAPGSEYLGNRGNF